MSCVLFTFESEKYLSMGFAKIEEDYMFTHMHIMCEVFNSGRMIANH